MTVLRISAKTADGKVIVPHSQGKPFFFNFGKSQVGELFVNSYFVWAVSFIFFVSYNIALSWTYLMSSSFYAFKFNF